MFHCDEVLANVMLRYTQEYSQAALIRTRAQEVLDQLDIVTDVGSVFDPSKNRFDHHQRSFNMAWHEDENKPAVEGEPFKIKLSSAGLVYKYFGKEILATILKEVWPESTYSEGELEKIYQKLYKNFILEVDAMDNGVKIAAEQNYHVNTNLGTRVSRFNKPWNAPASFKQNEQFRLAMRVAEEELLWHIYSISQVFWPARKQVEEAWAGRETFYPSGEFMYIENSCPWKDHLYNLEIENGKEGIIKFVFYKDGRGMYRVQTVAPKCSGYDMRVPLCKAWRGLRAEELKVVAGELQDIEFVHHSGFIGGTYNLQTALKMAELSIAEAATQ